MAVLSVATGLKTLFILLGCLMTATLIYTIATDGLHFRQEVLTPWMIATLVDFHITILAVVGVWVIYKESNWISAILWIILLLCLGSITTCVYIVLQFSKLSAQESSEDPVYYVLLRNKKEGLEQKSVFSVVTARFIFGALGCLMLGILIYATANGGVALTPWLSATIVDLFINFVALWVWIAYKEPSWIGASFWIILVILVGSAATCSYIVLQLFQLSSEDPVYLILFRSNNRDYQSIPEAVSETEQRGGCAC